ncbi:hypothetical protein FNQ90_11555 [Streptomyces alkaliphilus]|uniref:Uncharacterized protein n=1 Tax=Streptomyces alkaliphilus TaxID=1472722 RepID=A0A7W3TD75_9ACTN|nr:hypothetical protein [Streptomyces alkaliphilus]MBB0244724.1 hypothetical protein [Streptomyces alkaliphilus]
MTLLLLVIGMAESPVQGGFVVNPWGERVHSWTLAWGRVPSPRVTMIEPVPGHPLLPVWARILQYAVLFTVTAALARAIVRSLPGSGPGHGRRRPTTAPAFWVAAVAGAVVAVTVAAVITKAVGDSGPTGAVSWPHLLARSLEAASPPVAILDLPVAAVFAVVVTRRSARWWATPAEAECPGPHDEKTTRKVETR